MLLQTAGETARVDVPSVGMRIATPVVAWVAFVASAVRIKVIVGHLAAIHRSLKAVLQLRVQGARREGSRCDP